MAHLNPGGGRPVAIVTRPRVDAEPLAAALEAKGYGPVMAPLLELAQTGVPAARLERAANAAAALAFTSKNGVHAYAGLTPQRDATVFAVGARTADAARAAGFADVRDAGRDAGALAALIDRTLPPGLRSVLHLSGDEVAADLAELLKPAGVAVRRIAVYRMLEAAELTEFARIALERRTARLAVFLSPRTARVFVRLVRKARLVESVRGCDALVLSPAIAAEATKLPFARVIAAERPDLDALIAAIPPAQA